MTPPPAGARAGSLAGALVTKPLLIAGANLRRMVRYRANIFFMLLFPLLLILVIGAAFGGGAGSPRLGVVVDGSGPLTDRLVTALTDAEGLRVERVADADRLRLAVERGELAGGVVVPAGYDPAIVAGGQAELPFLARPDDAGQQLAITVRGVVADQAALLRAAQFAARETGQPFPAGLAAADAVAGTGEAAGPPDGPGAPGRPGPVGAVTVETSTVGEALFPESLGRFDVGASQTLLLFVFLSSLTGAVALVETRQLGVSRRMLATPTGVGTIIAGEALGRFGIALVQALIIMVGAGLLFGVDWGSPAGAGALVVLFGLTAAGAGMLVGAIFRSEQPAIGVGLMAGLGMAALGGSMLPIELFSGTMRTVARATPHAWANEGFAELVRRDGTLADILPQLGVLAGYAAVLFLLGGWLLRRNLTR